MKKHRDVYPFPQPVVGEAVGATESVLCADGLLHVSSMYGCKEEDSKPTVNTLGANSTKEGVKSGKGAAELVDASPRGPEDVPGPGSGDMYYDDRYWEIQQPESTAQVVDVQGRLRKRVKFWEKVLQAPSVVISWIREGYKLPLLYLPTPCM